MKLSKTQKEIVKALQTGGVLCYPRFPTNTWRLRMPHDSVYGGRVLRDPTVQELKQLGVLDMQFKLAEGYK